MIRKIITGFFIVVVLLVAGFVIFIKTVDLNQYMPKLTDQISRSLGRQVSVAKIGLNISLKQGVVIDVSGISLGDDPRFSNDPFLYIKHIHGGVSLIPLFTKRQVEITSIEIRSVNVSILKNEQGVFNYESMLSKQEPQRDPGEGASSQRSKPTVPKELPKLLVNSFAISDTKIVYQDKATVPPTMLVLDDVDAKVTGFSLTEPFQISLDASIFAKDQNLHIDGTSRIEMTLQQARLDDVHFAFDLTPLDVKRINTEIAALAPLGLESGLSGSVNAVISQMVVGAKGLLVLSLDGNITDVRIPLKTLATPIDHLTAKLDVTESKIKLKDFSFNLNAGKVSGNANIKDYMSSQDFEVHMSMDSLMLEEILQQSKSPAKIRGNLAGVLNMSGHGFTPELLDQIVGQSEVTLKDAELINVNVLKSILEKVPVLSALSQVAESQFSQELQTKIAGDSTKISLAKIKTRIEQSKILVDDMQMTAEKFVLVSHGQVGFDQEVDLTAELKFTKDMSKDLIESAGDMEALVDENGEIHFPVKISGKLPELSYLPDVDYISKILLINKGGGELQKVLDKNPEAKKLLDLFTGGDNAAAPEQQGPQSAGESGANADTETNDGQKALKGLLQGVFK